MKEWQLKLAWKFLEELLALSSDCNSSRSTTAQRLLGFACRQLSFRLQNPPRVVRYWSKPRQLISPILLSLWVLFLMQWLMNYLLFNRFFLFRQNQLDMAWWWHICCQTNRRFLLTFRKTTITQMLDLKGNKLTVDSSMSTVCAAPLFLCLVHLDVRYVEWINIQTFQL